MRVLVEKIQRRTEIKNLGSTEKPTESLVYLCNPEIPPHVAKLDEMFLEFGKKYSGERLKDRIPVPLEERMIEVDQGKKGKLRIARRKVFGCFFGVNSKNERVLFYFKRNKQNLFSFYEMPLNRCLRKIFYGKELIAVNE